MQSATAYVAKCVHACTYAYLRRYIVTFRQTDRRTDIQTYRDEPRRRAGEASQPPRHLSIDGIHFQAAVKIGASRQSFAALVEQSIEVVTQTMQVQSSVGITHLQQIESAPATHGFSHIAHATHIERLRIKGIVHSLFSQEVDETICFLEAL